MALLARSLHAVRQVPDVRPAPGAHEEMTAEGGTGDGEHVPGEDGHVECKACGRCLKCEPHPLHSSSGPY